MTKNQQKPAQTGQEGSSSSSSVAPTNQPPLIRLEPGPVPLVAQEDEEYKETIKNARSKLEVHMDAAMPCKKKTKCLSCSPETEARPDAPNNVPKTKNLMNPRDSDWNHLYQKVTKTILQGKGDNSMPQVVKNPDAKAAVDKEWKKLDTILAWWLDKVRVKRRLFWRHKETKEKSTLPH